MNEIYSKNDKKVNFALLTLVNTGFNAVYYMRSFFIYSRFLINVEIKK